MPSSKPFIPRNKPKFWVIGVLSGLLGLAFGLLGFTSAYFHIAILPIFFMGCFLICWLSFAVCWVGSIVGLVSGRYRNMQDRAWRDQVW